MAKEKREKLWLRCVNLEDHPSDVEIEQFLDSVARDDSEVSIFGNTISANILPDIPGLEEFKEWREKFMSVFQRHLETKWKEKDELVNSYQGDIDWLNHYPLRFERKLYPYLTTWRENGKLQKMEWTYTVEFRFDEKLSLMSYIVTQFNEYVASGQELRQCAADGCDNYFSPHPKARGQKFCSVNCRVRQHKRNKKKIRSK